MLFGNVFARFDKAAVPWVTYTDPELAHTGMTLEQAQQKYGDKLQVIEVPYAELDRAQAERETEGKIRVLASPKGGVLGVDIVGAGAGDLITFWGLMIAQKIKLRALSGLIVPYPTLADMNKKIVSAFYKKAFYSPKTGKISRFLFRWLG